jgi:hypothetical protein
MPVKDYCGLKSKFTLILSPKTMKAILVINDNSNEAVHAARFALTIAQKEGANILLADTCKSKEKIIQLVLVGFNYCKLDEYEQHSFHEKIILLNNSHDYFNVEIEEIDISGMNETQLAQYINREQIWLVIKGMKGGVTKDSTTNGLNIHTVLNCVCCPLLIVPEHWIIKEPERLVYIADLRYCRLQIVRFLTKFAAPFNADVLLAHLSAKGLPPIEENYACDIFNDEVSCNVKYARLFFNNIKERDLNIAVNVLTHGMSNDLMVMVNHRFHFEKIIGRYLTNLLPANITIPILIFPY